MKRILLLHCFLIFGLLSSAQEPYRNLIISEASLGTAPEAYVELTNKGSQTINLKDFELGKVSPWTSRIGYEMDEPCPPIENWFNVPENERMRLPDFELAPGESWVIANVSDWLRKMELKDPFNYRERQSQLDMYKVADYRMHRRETQVHSSVSDSIDPKYQVLEAWNGRDVFYIMHHFINGIGAWDSAVIDQVGGVFDDINCTNRDRSYSVAGIPGATDSHILLRKANVTQGNLDFFNGRGVDMEDSEWMPLPRQGTLPGGARRPVQWHTGNHGPFVLDENTLTPRAGSLVTVDYAAGIINVPWGIQRDDSLVFQFERTPGMGWEYQYVTSYSQWDADSDSAYLSARTGDVLRVYVAGNTLQWKDFTIQVAAPKAGDNIVVPKKPYNFSTGWYEAGSAYIDNAGFFRVTGGAEMDTIKHYYNIPGITFATRVDTLFKYLEKAPGASWEIVWLDNVERADLKQGDILRVTAENGAVKDYFIRVHEYRPDDNALLNSITWPDMPEMYRGRFGWVGDTIPGFSPTVYSYTLRVPGDVEGFPAIVAKPQNHNARVEVTRAVSYGGEREQRTVTFTVTAESDTTARVYTVLLEKEKMPEHIQPYLAEPIISEFIFWEQWENGYIEIVNTGTVPIDLSNYLFANRYSYGPASIFESELAHHNRYQLYIPGYKWTNSAEEWEIFGQVAEPDIYINPILAPGEVFTMGEIRRYNFAMDYENWYGATWWVPGVLDIDFGYRTDDGYPNGPNRTAQNPWGESMNYIHFDGVQRWGESVARQWKGADFYIFKILNESVKLGLKPANDPADFEVIEIFGTGDMSDYNAAHHPDGSTPMITSLVRKPEIHFPRPEPTGSFGYSAENTEWNYTDWTYWTAQNVGWPQEILFIALGLGSHEFIPPTHYMSFVTSRYYLVSPGYQDEEIRGVVTGTTVDQFLSHITKMDPGQTLTILTGDAPLLGNDLISSGNILRVRSADGKNTTLYTVEVTDEGLSNNATLTSTRYSIEVYEETGTGTISGFEYGTTLRDVRSGVNVPFGATLTVVDAQDRYVPLSKLNFDTMYVDVQVSDQFFFEVISENGETTILYQLLPESDPSDAFVYSDIYSVNQDVKLIDLVPEGTSVSGILGNLTPSANATMMVVDKNLMERGKGIIMRDDKIIVVSANGESSNIYLIKHLGSPQYYAYLTSPVYNVNQFNNEIIISIREDAEVHISEIRNSITLAYGATLFISDEDNNAKAENETIAEGDIFRVTSYDGLQVKNYTIVLDLIKVYDLAYIAGDNGIIHGTSLQKIEESKDGTAVEAIPDTGYHFVRWSDGVTDNPRTDHNITNSLTVYAEFAINSYTLTYHAGSNGTISGETNQGIKHGSDGTAVEAIPDTGYHFVRWSDGVIDNPRADMNITGPVSVYAEFAINVYSLTYEAGQNGTILGDAHQQIEHGSDGMAVEAYPETGYHFVQWSDGSSMNPRMEENVTENISLEAEFAINIYYINASAYPSGSGTISGQKEYQHGETITLTANPAEGYLFEKWTEEGSGFLGFLENPLIFSAERHVNLVANFIIDETTGIGAIGSSRISIWPNPADDILYIEGFEGGATVYIHDLNGSLILARDPVNNQIKINDLPPGIYILKFVTESQVITHRLIKQ